MNTNKKLSIITATVIATFFLTTLSAEGWYNSIDTIPPNLILKKILEANHKISQNNNQMGGESVDENSSSGTETKTKASIILNNVGAANTSSGKDDLQKVNNIIEAIPTQDRNQTLVKNILRKINGLDIDIGIPDNPLPSISEVVDAGDSTTIIFPHLNKGAFIISTPPAHGTASIALNSVIGKYIVNYTAPANYTGNDIIGIKHAIGQNISIDEKMVDITILPVNPMTNTSKTVNAGDTTQVTMPELTQGSYTVSTQPSHGTATISGNILTYTAGSTYAGPDMIKIEVISGSNTSASEATVAIAVLPVNPMANASGMGGESAAETVDAGDTKQVTLPVLTQGSYTVSTQPSHGTASVSGNVLTYTASSTYSGADAVGLKVVSGSNASTDEGTVDFTVLPVNPLTVINKDVDSGKSVQVTLPALTQGSYTITSGSSHGGTASVSYNSSAGSYVLTYNSSSSYIGTDVIKLKVTAGSNTSANEGSVVINVKAKSPITRSELLDLVAAYNDNPSEENKRAIETANVSQITNMRQIFQNSNFNGDLSSWDVSNVTDMSYMFKNAYNFNGDISSWDVSNVTNMYEMFQGCVDFNQPIGNWNVSKVTDFTYMFAKTYQFNQPIGDWNMSSAASIYGMFFKAHSFNQPIGDWDTSKVRFMMYTFAYSKSFNQYIKSWDVSKVEEYTDFRKDSVLSASNSPF